ncbi:MAG: hypothetical protein RL033_157 [Pseudomonadota bacterium]
MAGSRPFSAPAAAAAASPGVAAVSGWRRWHALLGAVPLAGYLFLHLGAQALALAAGPEQRALESAWERRPFWDGLVFAFVLLPLAAHAGLGLWRMTRASNDALWPAPLGRPLQRASALVLLLFLGAHVWQLGGRRWLGELARADYLAELCGSLSSTLFGGVPLVALGYLLGIAAAAVHVAQGLYHVSLSFGLVGEARRERLGRVCLLCGIFTFAVGALIVVRLATGSLAVGLAGANMAPPSP